jgi:8-oxo-dGTP pyrophosphatase MutT (NUDIX family)
MTTTISRNVLRPHTKIVAEELPPASQPLQANVTMMVSKPTFKVKQLVRAEFIFANSASKISPDKIQNMTETPTVTNLFCKNMLPIPFKITQLNAAARIFVPVKKISTWSRIVQRTLVTIPKDTPIIKYVVPVEKDTCEILDSFATKTDVSIQNKVTWHQKIICQYCSEIGHKIGKCQLFTMYRSHGNSFLYTNTSGILEYSDIKACSAAGIFPYCYKNDGTGIERKYILLALQRRRGNVKFNFLGGKRDTSQESPADIAKREFIEETTSSRSQLSILSHQTTNKLMHHKFTSVHWCGPSKYALYPFELDRHEANIDRKCKTFDEIIRLEWFTIPELIDEIKYKDADSRLHSFTIQMVKHIHDSIGLDNFV